MLKSFKNIIKIFALMIGVCFNVVLLNSQTTTFRSISNFIVQPGELITLRGKGIDSVLLVSSSMSFAMKFTNVNKARITGSGNNGDSNYFFNLPLNFIENSYWLRIRYANGNFVDSFMVVRVSKDKSLLTISGWGDNSLGQLNVLNFSNNYYVDFALGTDFTAGLLNNGNVKAWGDTLEDVHVVPTSINLNVVQVAAGRNHALALLNNGKVVAWGANDSNKATVPIGIDSVVKVFAGDNFSGVLRANGKIKIWGDTTYGIKSIEDSTDFIKDVVVAKYHGLYLTNQGEVKFWGDNRDSTKLDSIPNAAKLDVIGLRTGIKHAIVIKSTGDFVAWGDTTDGRLNFPKNKTYSLLNTGANHSMAIRDTTKLIAIGNNEFGEVIIPQVVSEADEVNRRVFYIYTGSLANYSFVHRNFVIQTEANQFGAISRDEVALRNDTRIIGYADPTGLDVAYSDSVFVNGNYLPSLRNSISLTLSFINSDYKIRVVFAKRIYNILTKTKNGIITPDTLATYFEPSSITYSPKDKYVIYGIYPNEKFNADASRDSLTRYTFNRVSADSFIRVIFWDTNRAFVRKLDKYLLQKKDTLNILGKKIGYIRLTNSYDSVKLNYFSKQFVASEGDTLYRFVLPPSLKTDKIYKILAYNPKFDSVNEETHQIRLYHPPDSVSYIISQGYEANEPNIDGQLNIPTDSHNFIYFTGASFHTLGLRADETVSAWGFKDNGQISVPVGLNKVIDVVAGETYSAALRGDGSIAIWGDSSGDASLGLKSFIDSENIVQLVASPYNLIALTYDGRILSWGRNNNIGFSTTINNDYGNFLSENITIPFPPAVRIASDIVTINGLISKDSLHIWADPTNFDFMSGRGSGAYEYNNSNYLRYPTNNQTSNFKDFSAGGRHGVAILRDSSLVQWGNTLNNPTIPALKAIAVATGGDFNNPENFFSVALKPDSTISVWGGNILPQIPLLKTPIKNIVSISAGTSSLNYFGLKRIMVETQQNFPFKITPNTFVKFKDSLIVSFMADTGYFIDSVFVNNVYVDSIKYKDTIKGSFKFKNITEDSLIYVQYKLRKFIICTMDTNGSITPTDSQANYLQPVTITYKPDTGYKLDSIFINGIYKPNLVRDSPTQYTFRKILGDSCIRVVFGLKRDTIFTSVKNGFINPTPPYRLTDYFTPVVVSYSSAGYKLDSIYIDDKYDSAATKDSLTRYTFSKVLKTRKIRVVYKIDSFWIFTEVKNGTISPSKKVTVKDTTIISYAALDNEYRLDSIFIDDVFYPLTTRDSMFKYTFAKIAKNTKIRVVYNVIDTFKLVANLNKYIYHPQDTIFITSRNLLRITMKNLLGFETVFFNNSIVKTPIQNSKDSLYQIVVPRNIASDIYTLNFYGVQNRILPYKLIRIYPSLYDSALYLAWNTIAVPKILQNVVTFVPGRRFAFALQSNGSVIGWDTSGRFINNLPIRFDSTIIDIGLGGTSQGTQYILALKSDGTTTSWAERLSPEIVTNSLVKIFPTRNYHFGIRTDSSVFSFGSFPDIEQKKMNTISAYIGYLSFNILPLDTLETKNEGGVINLFSMNRNNRSTLTLSSGNQFTIVLYKNGSINSLGDTNSTDLISPRNEQNISQIATNANATIALKNTNSLKTFGMNIDTPMKNNQIISVFGQGDVASYHYMRFIKLETQVINGFITPSSNIKAYSNVLVTFSPIENYSVDSIWIDGIYNDALTKQNPSSYIFDTVVDNHSIIVKYRQNEIIIKSLKFGNGFITPLGNTNVRYGDSLKFTIKYADTVLYDSLVVDKRQVTKDTVYVFRNITDTHTIIAYFRDATVPDSPRNARALPSNSCALINFDPPLNDGGLPILKYVVTSTSNGLNLRDTITSTSVQICGLTNGLPYQFFIRAINIKGASLPTRTNVVVPTDGFKIINVRVVNGKTPSNFISIADGLDTLISFQNDTGYSLDSIYINNVFNPILTAQKLTNYTFVNVTGDSSIRVVYKLDSFKIYTSVVNGFITPRDSFKTTFKDLAEVGFSPATFYILDSIFINKKYDTKLTRLNATSYTFRKVLGDSSIRVVYKKQILNITTSVVNGQISASRDIDFFDSIRVTYLKENDNYIIDSVIVDGMLRNDSMQGFTFRNIQNSHSIKVVYKLKSFIISTLAINGIITPTFSVKVLSNPRVTYSGVDFTYRLDSVWINNIYSRSASDSIRGYTFNNVRGDSSIRVSFKKNTFIIRSSKLGGGQILPLGDVEVFPDSNQTFVIMYPDTIVYDSLVVDGIKVIKRDTFTFFNVSMNHTIQAYFSDVNVPDSPQNAQAVAGSSKATISFSLPLSNGGAPILFYTISYFNNGNLIEMQVPNAGSYVISGLSNDQAYTFNIYAHNIKGRSLPARTNAVVPILDLKSIFVTKIYDDTTYLDTLKIEINRDTIINYQPLSNYIIDSVFINNVYYENLKSLTMYQFRDIRGDSGIKIKYKYTGYTITTQVFGNGTVTPLWIIKIGANRDTSVSISHSNLSIYDSLVIDNENINDTPSIYNFTNVTSNHTLKAYFTKIGRPDSPQMARAVAGNSKASILFAYPLSDSGGKVLFYTVYSTSNGIQIQISNPNAPILISGLTNGLSYDFLVTATNIAGESDAAHIYNVVPQAHLILVNTEVINGTITPSFSTLINTDSTIHYQGELGTILDSIYINGRYDSQITADSITAYTFKNIRDDSAIKVVYKIRQFNILTSAVHGYISMPFKVNYNMDARVSFQPDAGYTLDSVFINNRYIQDISNKFSYIFKNVTADSVIKVIFKPIVYDIQSAVMGLGNITPLGNVKVRQDSTQIFIISYGDTVRYDSLVVDNIKVMAKDTFIFPNVRTHHTIVAYFTEIKVPDSPQNAMATVLNKSAEISFNTPLSDGGAPILYYKIYYDSLGILVFLDTTTWSPIIIKNLVDKPYTFYIKAVNRRGESLPARTQTVQPTNYNYIFISKIYNTLTIDTIQVNNGQDTTLTILGLPNFVADSVFYNGVYQSNLKGFNNITLHFQNITGDSFVRIVYRFVNGFKLITKVYGNGTISPSGTSFIFANTDTTVTISHPVNSRYDSIKINGILQDTLFLKYPIRSINKDYLIEAYFSYIGRPDSPQNAIAIPGNRKAVISFDYPKTDSGSVVLYYTIYYTLNGVTQSQTSTNSPVTLSGLINGQTYSIQVTATNIVGESIKTRTFYVTPQANIFIITTEVRNGTITPSFNIRGIPDSTIRYAPLEGYTLDSIYINGIYHAQITRDSISAYTFKNILGDSSIKVVYKLKQFTIHIEVVNGTISGLNQVKYNENILIQFRPTIGYGLDSIYINGIYNNILSMSGVTSYRFDNVKADSSIKVVYKLLYFTITTVVKGGTISDTIRNVIYGSRYKITFNPLKGYFLDSLIINGRYEPEYYNKLIDSYIFNNVLGDSSIYVVFAPKEFDVMSTIGGDVLGGSITPLGINKVKFDGYILFTIDLNYGFVVDSLIIDGVLIPYTKNFEFFNVDSNHTIHVVFRRDLFRITHLSNYGGVFNPAKDTDVNLGNNYTFNVLPFSGYIIDSVFLNDASLPVNNFNNTYFIYTISNVNQFYRVRVVFKQILLSISYRNFKFKITNNSCYGDSIGRIDLNVDSFAYYKYEFIDLNGNISYDSFLGTSFLIGSKLKAGDYTIKIWFKGFQNLFVGTYYLKVTEPKPITEFSSIRIEKKTIILNLEGAPDFYVSINNNTWNLKPSTTSLPLQNGINKIVVKSFKNCLDSIVETIYISSGFNLFPNPANAVINLVFEDAETELNFEVYNNNGQLIDKGFKQFLGGVSAKNIQLNIEGYPSGVYFIKILNGQAKGFYRFIKN